MANRARLKVPLVVGAMTLAIGILAGGAVVGSMPVTDGSEVTYINAAGRQLKLSAAPTRLDRTLQMVGSAGDRDQLHQGHGAEVLVGGSGDDTFVLWDPSNIVREEPGGGNDTIISHVDGLTVLPPNVENLKLTGDYAWAGRGNDADNLIIASDRNCVIDGGGGDDVFVSGRGANVFNIARGRGSKVIYGFKVGADRVRLEAFGITDFAALVPEMQQAGADTVLSLGSGQRVILRNIRKEALGADQFLLELDVAKLVPTFTDDFNRLDTRDGGGVWRTSFGFGGYADRGLPGEQQVYVDPAYAGTGKTPLGLNPFAIRDGILAITAAPTPPAAREVLGGLPYTSGLISSTGAFAQQFGYFEIRAKLPSGQGYLPQFWLMPVSGKQLPEIDIMEAIGRQPGVIHMTIHFGEPANSQSVEALTWADPRVTHLFGLDWTRDWLTWYVDRVAVARTRATPDMAQPYYAILNLAMGNEWAGRVDATTGTGSFEIDYFKAFGNRDTTQWTLKGRTTQRAAQH